MLLLKKKAQGPFFLILNKETKDTHAILMGKVCFY